LDRGNDVGLPVCFASRPSDTAMKAGFDWVGQFIVKKESYELLSRA
jgi:hypothetical protein